jgi:hypothetical protein
LTFAAVRTKEQNSTAERKNRSVMDKVLTSLHSTGTPLQYCGDFYLPSKSNKDFKTPFSLHHGYNPNVTFFRKLGSLCWVFQELEVRSQSQFEKLSPKYVPCRLIALR